MGAPRNPLDELEQWIRSSRRALRHKLATGCLTSPELEETRKALENCLTVISGIELDSDSSQYIPTKLDNDSEIARLFALNRFLRGISHFLLISVTDIRQHIATKQPWAGTFEAEYDIDARIAYAPHRDDPAVQTGDDSPLANRELSLASNESVSGRSEILCDDKDWNDRFPTNGLGAEPHCWLFHDLYDHGYGYAEPALSLHDCLRVGEVRIDIVTELQLKKITVR